MRRLLAIVATALFLAAPAAATPETEYRVVRVLPNGNLTTLSTFDVGDGSLTQEQVIRATTFQYADTQRINNAAWRIVIYGPTNGGPYTIDDVIWDSAVNL